MIATFFLLLSFFFIFLSLRGRIKNTPQERFEKCLEEIKNSLVKHDLYIQLRSWEMLMFRERHGVNSIQLKKSLHALENSFLNEDKKSEY